MPDELLRHNAEYVQTYDKGSLPGQPARKLAIVACMDARLNVYGMLGMTEGDAHIIRNAGGVVSEDAIRSLLISQRLLGTEHIFVIHHTDCGMTKFSEDALKQKIEDETGIRPPFALEAFQNPESDVRQSVARIKTSPFIPHRESVRGFVFDVKTGELSEVDASPEVSESLGA